MPGGEQMVRIAGRRLRLTNLDKVLYPATGTTKGEVIDYYTRIAPLLLPHVAGRPVTRIRWPEGVGEPSFFAKDLERGAPSWVERMPVEHSGGVKAYPLVDDVPTLVYLAQVASLELHVPQWRFNAASEPAHRRFNAASEAARRPSGAAPARAEPDEPGTRGNPDRLVLDLDPGPGTGLAECAEVARWARGILTGMGLDPRPVTSGSKGIHLYAALPGAQSSDEVVAVARELARAIEADHPDLVVGRMAKAQRPGKVFIDWSQNNAAKTTIAPYSLRGRTHPTVAAPRTWEELDDPHLSQLLFHEVLARAATIGDPLQPLGSSASARGSDQGPLTAYLAKRSPAHTPEPMPAQPPSTPVAPGEAPRFVVQEHHASRLHYDLRLERDGVLVSWAVPRGIPPTSEQDHLAIMTEPHPMEYASFEGEIPRGEYGAGTMTIWDAGRYELEKWRDDEVIVTLKGRPGGPLGERVRLALIRTDGAGEKSTWLLHRMKDGRSAPNRPPARAAPAAAPVPMLAVPATPGVARRTAARWGRAWAEMKWDGVRALGLWDGERLQLRARSGNDITRKYPELTALDAGLGTAPAVVDGEIVALDARGRPSFTRLQARMNVSKPHEIDRELPRTPVHLYLFDVLSHGGSSTTDLPLARRREILEALAARTIAPIVVPPVFDDVDAALTASSAFGLEGIVVKDPRSPYRPGTRAEAWLKVKLTRTQEVVIGGIRPGRGGRSGSIGSLLVGIPGPEGLRYAGRVGTGFSEATLSRLGELLMPLRTDRNPFVGVPAADAADAFWVRPELVGEVELAEFTPGGILRHARWRGMRPDKSPDEVAPEA